jgi:YfiH family protein
MGYISLETNNLPIKAITTTRQDGFSSIPFDQFNLSYGVGDNPDSVLKNRNKLCEDLRIAPYNLIIPKQNHGDKILKVEKITDDREADCLYTSNKDLALSVIHSDCAPIFIYAADKEIICSIHASIKGSLTEITKKAVKTLINKEKVDPKNIYAFYGPGVTFSHLEAHEDTFKKVEKLGYTMCLKRSMGIDYIDINLLNYMQLIDCGVPAKQIILNKYDTYDNANLFFSSMRNNVTGRMLSVIQFKKESE